MWIRSWSVLLATYCSIVSLVAQNFVVTIASVFKPQAYIEFVKQPNGDTGVGRQLVGYPFHLGRTLRFSGDPAGMSSLYLQSCSGGIFQGDDLGLRLAAQAGTQSHVTSAASTIVHSMNDGREARHRVLIEAAPDSLLEYLPDPLVIFPRANLQNEVMVYLHPGARVLLGEALVLHDPDLSGQVFDRYVSETLVRDGEGHLLVRDRFRIDGETLQRNRPGINGRYRAQASFFALSTSDPAPLLVAALRRAIEPISGVYAAASALPNGAGAWMRLLADDAVGLRQTMHAAWVAMRFEFTGLTPASKRK